MAMYVDSLTGSTGLTRNSKEGRVRPANLAQDEGQQISFSSSTYCTERKVTEESSASGLLAEESETEFISKVTSNKKLVDRERSVRYKDYGAIVSRESQPIEGEEKEKLIPTKRRQSAATIGKDYEKVASRNKRAQHATTYVCFTIYVGTNLVQLLN